MSEENKESPIVPVSMDSWVEWFRSVAPHIHSIRGKTIVIDTRFRRNHPSRTFFQLDC